MGKGGEARKITDGQSLMRPVAARRMAGREKAVPPLFHDAASTHATQLSWVSSKRGSFRFLRSFG